MIAWAIKWIDSMAGEWVSGLVNHFVGYSVNQSFIQSVIQKSCESTVINQWQNEFVRIREWTCRSVSYSDRQSKKISKSVKVILELFLLFFNIYSSEKQGCLNTSQSCKYRKDKVKNIRWQNNIVATSLLKVLTACFQYFIVDFDSRTPIKDKKQRSL